MIVEFSSEAVERLADAMRVLPEDVNTDTIGAYMDELEAEARGYAADPAEALYAAWAAASGVPTVSGSVPAGMGEEPVPTEAERLLADPEVQRCLAPRTLDDVASCYQPLRSSEDVFYEEDEDDGLPDDPAALRAIIRQAKEAEARLAAAEDDLYEQFAPLLGVTPSARAREDDHSSEEKLYRDWHCRWGGPAS